MGRRVHRSATLLLSLLMALIGVGLIVQALSGTHRSVGLLLLLGILFLAGGTGRIYVEHIRGRGRQG
jgi:hypothetical protein